MRYIISAILTFALVIFIYPALTKTNPPCANSLSCQESLKLKIENGKTGFFNNQKVQTPEVNVTESDLQPSVLGAADPTKKHIYVNLKTQTLSAYDGDSLFMETPISSGKWFPTPTGEFTIWTKIRATRMTGGTGADYYNLPNVPYVMYFYNEKVPQSSGFSLHGTYWHNNFGHPMSHGCVNMKLTDAAKLYDWATPVTDGLSTLATVTNPGTKITITDGN